MIGFRVCGILLNPSCGVCGGKEWAWVKPLYCSPLEPNIQCMFNSSLGLYDHKNENIPKGITVCTRKNRYDHHKLLEAPVHL